MRFINNIVIILSLMISLFSKNYLVVIWLIPLLGLSLLIRKYNKKLELVYLLFLFVSYILGYVYDFYDEVYFFDALVHSLFGLFAGIYALPLLKILKKYDFKNRLFNVIFIIIFSLSMASLWEIFEFVIDKIFVNANMQRSLNNTMKDIISAFLFSIMYAFIYFEKSRLIEKLFITKD